MAEWPMAPVLKTGGSKGSVGSNPTPRVSRDDVKVNMLDSFSGSPGSSPGPAIEDANSNSYIITLLLLSCVLFVLVKT